MDNALIELEKMVKSGIRLSVRPTAGGFLVLIGGFHMNPDAQVFTNSLDEAVAWLREQIKDRYPDSAYGRALLTN